MGSSLDDFIVRGRSSSVRYPHSVVWTPIPLLTWIIPIIGHTGICTSEGKIRDFAGSYYVSEENMAFGNPTKYWKLNLNKAKGGAQGWDAAVREASLEYCGRMHNLVLDNCHSHVATALNLMEYNGQTNWNMGRVGVNIFLHGTYVSKTAWIKTWAPFLIILMVISVIVFMGHTV